ncbi:unnamed protein product, partial [Rotaria sordida]
EPKTFDESVFPPNLQNTITNQKFILSDNSDHHRRLLIFASKEQLGFSNGRESWHCDDTFSERLKSYRIFQPRCDLLICNCQSKKGLMCVEWAASSNPLYMAFIFIKNLFSNDETQFKWNWKQKNIIQMIKRLQNDENQLNALIKVANFVLSSIHFNVSLSLS